MSPAQKVAAIAVLLMGMDYSLPHLAPAGFSFPDVVSWFLPSNAPIHEAGLRVLVTYDPNKASLSRAQASLVDSHDLREWMNANCVKPADGSNGWKVVPAGKAFGDDQPVWRDAIKLVPADQKNWLIVSNGKRGVSMPLPASEAEALATIQRFK